MITLSKKEAARLGLASSSPKYNNTKTQGDGLQFDSALEARRYAELEIEARLGVITDLELQPVYTLLEGFKDAITGRRHRAITYRGDFRYRETATGRLVVEDTKGCKTAVFRIKEKLFRNRYPDIELRITG